MTRRRGAGTRRGTVALAASAVAAISVAGGTSAGQVHLRPDGAAAAVEESVPVVAVPAARAVSVLEPADRPVRFTLVVGGDLLVHEAVWRSAAAHATASGASGFDFRPMFDQMRPFIASADLALCHLETPLSSDNGHIASFPVFSAPFELADAVADAGFDGCSVASNHTLDQGAAGVDATLGHLDRVGVGHTGAARSEQEALTTRVYDVHGRRVAHLSYSYGFNGFRVPDGEWWRANQIDVPRITGDAFRARMEGADIVLVSLHFGTEYRAEPSAYQRDLAGALSASPDIDLVIGHHAHVVQPVATVGTLPVIYGLGNLLSNMTQPERRDGVLVRVTLDHAPGQRARVTGIDALPTQVLRDGHRIVIAAPDSWQRTMSVLSDGGTPVPPVELPPPSP